MKISGHTKVIAIFGDPVEHTLSPAMHNAAFAALGLDCVYIPFHVRPNGLREAVLGLRAMDFAGANITVPHKERVIAFLDEVDEEARLLGAVNTIVNRDGVLKGYNTDGRGFIMSLKEDAKFDPAEKKVFICGAGGAARGIGFALAAASAKEIMFFDIEQAKMEGVGKDIMKYYPNVLSSVLKDRLIRVSGEGLPQNEWMLEVQKYIVSEVDLVINATPLGMKETDPLPINPEFLHEGQLFYDIVYNPAKTAAMAAAEKAGARALNGLGMLLYQGVIAFEHWLGVLPPVEIMREALEKGFKVKKI